jgi:hypothetical protein
MQLYEGGLDVVLGQGRILQAALEKAEQPRGEAVEERL